MKRIKAAVKRALDGYFDMGNEHGRIIRQRVEQMIHNELDEEGWISVKDRLPVIPEGQYGVPVLVAQFDHVFEECCPGRGYTVRCKSYGTVRMRDGSIRPEFDGTDLDFDFMELSFDGRGGVTMGPVMDEIRYWMYLPDPPND
jgi:hypothetical protein